MKNMPQRFEFFANKGLLNPQSIDDMFAETQDHISSKEFRDRLLGLCKRYNVEVTKNAGMDHELFKTVRNTYDQAQGSMDLLAYEICKLQGSYGASNGALEFCVCGPGIPVSRAA